MRGIDASGFTAPLLSHPACTPADPSTPWQAPPAAPDPAIPPIEGAQVSTVILDGITADVGETVAIVLRGDGVNGVFTGRLAAVGPNVVSLILTRPVGPIPAGTIVAILRVEIAAAARLGSSGTDLDP